MTPAYFSKIPALSGARKPNKHAAPRVPRVPRLIRTRAREAINEIKGDSRASICMSGNAGNAGLLDSIGLNVPALSGDEKKNAGNVKRRCRIVECVDESLLQANLRLQNGVNDWLALDWKLSGGPYVCKVGANDHVGMEGEECYCVSQMLYWDHPEPAEYFNG